MNDETKPGLPTVEQVTAHERHGGLWRLATDDQLPTFHLLAVLGGRRWVVNWERKPQTAIGFLPDGEWTPCDKQGNPVGLRAQLEEAQRTIASLSTACYKAAYVIDEYEARRLAPATSELRAANEDMAKRLAAAQARIGALETEVASMRDARVSAWPRLVGLLELPADAMPGAVVSAVETAVRQSQEALACFQAEQERAEALLRERIALLGDEGTPKWDALLALVGHARPHVERAMLVNTGLLGSMISTRAESETDLDVAAACLAVLLARREQEGAPYVHVIELSPEGQRQFAEAILGPPQPGERLKTAVKHYREVMGTIEPERRTCGACKNCRTVHSRRSMAICRHHRVMNEEREVIPMDAPPGWCPGFDPRD